MKKWFILAAAAMLAGCSPKPVAMHIEVANPTDSERKLETVEVAWNTVTEKLGQAAVPGGVVVYDQAGAEIPSQVLYNGGSEPVSLIFQATVAPEGTAAYTVEAGTPAEYPVQAYGRYVPERMDDYAWENNLVAGRLYGPALEVELVTPGIDVWVKCTDKLVIDEWFAKADYHHNYGDGMDCYKVGPTLGGGACAPYMGDKLWLSRNYATQQNLDNGPIRTSVRLTYAPFQAGDYTVSLTKVISLDANTRFSKMVNTYEGDFETMPVAAGDIRHDVKGTATGDDWAAMTEAASDTDDPVRDGDISLAIVMPGATSVSTDNESGHMLVIGQAENGKPLTYWSGTAWSGAGVADIDAWKAIVEAQAEAVANPLIVTVK